MCVCVCVTVFCYPVLQPSSKVPEIAWPKLLAQWVTEFEENVWLLSTAEWCNILPCNHERPLHSLAYHCVQEWPENHYMYICGVCKSNLHHSYGSVVSLRLVIEILVYLMVGEPMVNGCSSQTALIESPKHNSQVILFTLYTSTVSSICILLISPNC